MIVSQLLFTATIREHCRNIHNKSLSFFPNRTIDGHYQIFDPILTKHKDDKRMNKVLSNVYKLTFQSNGEISSRLNLDQKNLWDADIEKTFTIFRKSTWQA